MIDGEGNVEDSAAEVGAVNLPEDDGDKIEGEEDRDSE